MNAISSDIAYTDKRPKVVGRFAPSPSGRFHVGNIFSSLIAALVADEVVLRIEDLDPDRSKQEHIDGVMRDLDWFGFEWVGEVLYQSSADRQYAYTSALEQLQDEGMVYPCFCTRADLHSARAPHAGEEFVYANTCKYLTAQQQEERRAALVGREPALRLAIPEKLSEMEFNDLFQGEQHFDLLKSSGDFIIRRSDGVFAYQLAVVVDDAASGINSVVRGADLLSSTPKQMLLQQLLGYATPVYGHVPIFVDDQGRKLSKRNNDATLGYLIEEMKLSPEQILGYLAYLSGIVSEWEGLSISELKHVANLDALKGKRTITWIAPKNRR